MLPHIIKLTLTSLNYYLSPQQRRQAFIQFGLLLFSSVLDVFGLAALVPVLLVAAEPGGVQQSRFFQPIYQAFGFTSERSFLVVVIVAMLVFFLLKNVLTTWINYMQARVTSAIGQHITGSQLDKYLNLPFWYFTDFGSANLINNTLSVPGNYVGLALRPLFMFFSELTVIVVIVIAVLIYNPILILVLALILGPTAWLTYRSLRVRAQVIGNQLDALRVMSVATITDLFSGFVELKLAARQQRFAERLLANQALTRDLDAEMYLHSMLPVRVIEMVAILGIMVILMYSIFFPATGGGLIALVGTFAAAAYRLMPSINRLLTSLLNIKNSQYTFGVLAALRGPEFDERPPAAQYPIQFQHELALEHVSFRFPSQEASELPALNDISFRIKRGEKIGFVGASGSGKTTLMNLLLRFYQEQQGQVLVDGQQLTSHHLQAWHRMVGYVKQDTFLMEATIQDNITLGATAEEVDSIRLQRALDQASLTDFVHKLPQGLNTFIGERGSKLSGGQRQRIGIARALYKQAEILLLDEATSALDNETEREVNEAISRLAHTDITVLIIAHRLTTLRECDRIYELSNGRVVAERQYAELVS